MAQPHGADMTPVARTVAVFGVYMLGVGLTVLLVLNVLLGVLGLPLTDEPWIRIAGVLVVVLAGYYITCARSGSVVFMSATVPGRVFVAVALVVVAGVWGYWAVLLFAIPDAAGAAWTWSALRRRAPAARAQAPAA